MSFFAPLNNQMVAENVFTQDAEGFYTKTSKLTFISGNWNSPYSSSGYNSFLKI